MCIGVPMKIVETGFGVAVCESKGKRHEIDTMLIGEQPVGTWVLVFINAARQVIEPDEAMRIASALEALEKVMAGDNEIDHLFPDLISTNKT